MYIAVLDDNPTVAAELAELSKACMPEPHRVFSFSSAADLLAFVQSESLDVLLTDIRMPVIDGISIAELLHSLQPWVQTIFVSQYTSYIENSFHASPITYLLKPVTKERLQAAFDSCRKQIVRQGTFLQVHVHGTRRFISVASIRYLESRQRHVHIQTETQLDVFAKLDELESQLPDFFLRTHKSFLINPAFAASIKNYRIKLTDGKTNIPVSRPRYREVKEALLRYWGSRL